MRFPFPCFPAEFEIPDSWWVEAGMPGFTPQRKAYNSTTKATRVVSLRDIEPPFRFPEYPKDWRGFDRLRLVSILKGFVTDAQIEPVPLVALPDEEFPPSPFRFRVCNGLHRFYASVAAGFEGLPSVITEPYQP